MNEVDVVRRIFDMALKGVSTVNIADNLNALGIPSCCHSRDVRNRIGTNTKWRATTVYRMLKSTTYKGIRKYGKNRKKAIEHKIPAIIPVEIWEQVQKILASNKIMIKGNCKHQYLLRGLMKCEHCGHSYVGTYTDGYTYYVDIGRRNWRSQQMDAPCFGKTINRDWIENKVWESCLEFIRNPQLVVKSINSMDGLFEKIENDIAVIRSRIDSNALENQRLIELYKKGFISMDDVSIEFEKVSKEKEMLQSELAKLEEEYRKDDLMRQVDTAVDVLELLQQKVDRHDVPFETKRIVVETMIEKITVNSDYDKTAYITIYFRFGDRKSTTYSKSMARQLKGKDKSKNTCNTFTHASPHENVLQVKVSFFAPLPYQAIARKVREVHKKNKQ
jgi:site-specific DNA recombinase